MPVIITAVGVVLVYWVLSTVVVVISVRLHEGYLEHATRIKADERAAHQRYVRKFGVSMEQAKAKVIYESLDYPGAKFIHAWADRVTDRGLHPLAARHRRAVRAVVASS